MTGLISAEARRFLSRRFFRWLGVAVLAMIVLQVTLAFVSSSNDADSGLAEAQREVAFCEQEQIRIQQTEGAVVPEPWDCPTVEEMRQNFDNRFNYATTMRDAFQGLGVFCLVLGLVIGATFVGAEWASGSMTILLTWEARRIRVLLAKVTACYALLAVILAVLLALVAVVFYPVATLRGTTDGMTATFWWTQAGTGLRDVFLGLFGATVGMTFAMLVRNSAGAIGVAFFYGAIADPILGAWRKGFIREWLLQYNVARLLGLAVPVEEADPTTGFEQEITKVLTASRSAIVLAVYAVAFLLISYVTFNRRDVT